MSEVKGYNIAFKVDGKTLAGVTQDDLKITAVTKESITKADAGVKHEVVVGHNVSFSSQGVVDVSSTTSASTEYRDAILVLAAAVGTEAEVDFVYSCADGDDYEGVAVITAYSESSGSEDEATYNVTFEVIGELTKVEDDE